MPGIADEVIKAARKLSRAVNKLEFADPVTHVYNPLQYAWAAHEQYIRQYGDSTKKVVFLGMNPGPFGMAQTGVPFGEISLVRDWIGIETKIKKPANEHPKRPIDGFDCRRSEVSGARLWGLFKDKFKSADVFFADHFVVNYCPLVFMGETGKNITPPTLKKSETEAMYAACDRHLREVVALFAPEFLVGVGKFAEERARKVLGDDVARIETVLHPSPASPLANRGWAPIAEKQMKEIGAW